MIGAISGPTPLPKIPQTSAGQNPSKARASSLEKQIDALEAKAKTCGCSDTAAELNKEATALKAQLSSLQTSDSQASSQPSDTTPPPVAAPKPNDLDKNAPISANANADNVGAAVHSKRSDNDYRPLITKASTAVQIALSNLNSSDPRSSAQDSPLSS